MLQLSSSFKSGPEMDRKCLDQSGPRGGPNWTSFGPLLDRALVFGPAKGQVTEKMEQNLDRNIQRIRQYSEFFLSQKLPVFGHFRQLCSFGPVVSKAVARTVAFLHLRCGPCTPLTPQSSWLLRLASARSIQEVATHAAQPIGSAVCFRGSRVSFAVTLACCVSITSGCLAREGWTSLGSTWGDEAAVKIDRIAPRISSKTWGGSTSFDERSRPSQNVPDVSRWTRPARGSKLAGLRDVISLAESKKRRYNSIHLSAKRLPKKKPVDLTIGEIFDWIDDTPGQHHAIGFYQIIPSTLRSLVTKAGLSLGERFNQETQDMLGDILIAEAGYSDFLKGRKSPDAFMDALAKIWAGLPMRNGRSAYHGYAGNRAMIERAFFEAEVRRIFDLPEKRS